MHGGKGLEFHHQRPFGHGGDHSVANISLACRCHNRLPRRGRLRPGSHRSASPLGDPSLGADTVFVAVTTVGDPRGSHADSSERARGDAANRASARIRCPRRASSLWFSTHGVRENSQIPRESPLSRAQTRVVVAFGAKMRSTARAPRSRHRLSTRNFNLRARLSRPRRGWQRSGAPRDVGRLEIGIGSRICRRRRRRGAKEPRDRKPQVADAGPARADGRTSGEAVNFMGQGDYRPTPWPPVQRSAGARRSSRYARS